MGGKFSFKYYTCTEHDARIARICTARDSGYDHRAVPYGVLLTLEREFALGLQFVGCYAETLKSHLWRAKKKTFLEERQKNQF